MPGTVTALCMPPLTSLRNFMSAISQMKTLGSEMLVNLHIVTLQVWFQTQVCLTLSSWSFWFSRTRSFNEASAKWRRLATSTVRTKERNGLFWVDFFREDNKGECIWSRIGVCRIFFFFLKQRLRKHLRLSKMQREREWYVWLTHC